MPPSSESKPPIYTACHCPLTYIHVSQITFLTFIDGGLFLHISLYNAVYTSGTANPTITETIRLHRLRWFGHIERMGENRTPKRVLSMKLEATRPRGRPRNRWEDEVREDGSIVGGEEWQGKVYEGKNGRGF
jgi:hypothetical protein